MKGIYLSKPKANLSLIVDLFASGYIEKQTLHTFVLMARSENSHFCGFNPIFFAQRGVTHTKFVSLVFQGSEFCDADGKTDPFRACLRGF